LRRPIQARLEAWEFTKKRALTEQDNSLELKQLSAVFAHGLNGVLVDRLGWMRRRPTLGRLRGRGRV